MRHPPIHATAQELNLALHPLDTFKTFNPPPTDLVIAVSFGLLIPARIISHATHGGLNVHPSLLPDLHGPAPILRALLDGDKHGGVTVQTLHPTKFDAGQILAQMEKPGVELPMGEGALAKTVELLGKAGAEMLVKVIEERTFTTASPEDVTAADRAKLAGTKDATSAQSSSGVRHAKKITSADRHLAHAFQSRDTLHRRDAIIGPLWDDTTHPRTEKLLRTIASTPPDSRSAFRRALQDAMWKPMPEQERTRVQYADWTDVPALPMSSEAQYMENLRVSQDLPGSSKDTSNGWEVGGQAPQVRSAMREGVVAGIGYVDGSWRLLFWTGDGVIAPGRMKIEGKGWRDVRRVLQGVNDAWRRVKDKLD